MMRSLIAPCAALLICACQLPNPYTPPSPPQPASGGTPSLPAPTPESVPPPAGEPESSPQVPPPVQPPREYMLGPASTALVNQARTQAAAGNYAGASASIERALGIEPNNPLLWIELGQVRQAEGNFEQAENLGRKALSLAGGDPRTQAAAWRLIADALRARGRVQAAREAEARADSLVPR